MSDAVDTNLAERLILLMRGAGREALIAFGEELKSKTIESIPVEDPQLDPDPDYQLRDHVEVRVYGNFVSVSVEGAYAVRQHESLHLQHPRGGYPKFLERNVAELTARIPVEIEGIVRRTFATGKSFETHVRHGHL